MSADPSNMSCSGYWPSYNVPFYENIYDLSGYPMMKKKVGNFYSHQLTVRAEIFRRDQGSVTNMQSLISLMRYNGGYQSFPVLVENSL